jgi:hypothetical protein
MFDSAGPVRQGEPRGEHSSAQLAGGTLVGQKTVKFSDLSGELIIKDDSLARIVVHEHPELGGGPVEIEVHADEARAVDQAAIQVAVVDLYFPDEDEPRRTYMDLAAFDELSTEQPMSELLASARPARRGAKSSAASPARADRMNYSSLEHAGRPHRGKVTDEEKQLVREHFDEVNDRLAAAGLRTISLSDPDHVDRYDLAGLAAERGISGSAPGPESPRAAARADADDQADLDGIDEPAELDDLARTTAA